ncbi:MAG: isoaspartyl peptidase/L-asparaginase [Thermoprotei archaeon]
MARCVVIATWEFGLEGVKTAMNQLKNGETAINAVELGIMAVESLGIRSVGISGLPNTDGEVELDASIMSDDGRAGGVAAVKGVEHPISLARKVMELTPHVLLVGDGARKFAKALGMRVDAKPSEQAIKQWAAAKEEAMKATREAPDPWYWAQVSHDTVGMVAMDTNGNLAAGASTSGLAYKMPGRVGDTPIIGAGVYARSGYGAAAATGVGEIAIRNALTYRAVTLMKDLPAKDALDEALKEVRLREPRSKEISLVGIDHMGNWGAATLREQFPFALWDGQEPLLLRAFPP